MIRAIAFGGLVAGTLDILDAFVFSYARGGVSPLRVLQAIASGWLGRSSYEGGLPTAALGLGLHFFIATAAAAVFVTASRFLPVLLRRPVQLGLAYGVAVYVVMNHVVLPLSAFRTGPFAWPGFINGVLIHALGVGLPIALIARRHLGRQ